MKKFWKNLKHLLANPRKNTTFCRYKFFTYRQSDGQTFDKYLTEMKKLCNDCDLGTLKNSLLTDMLIIGLFNKRIQEKLMKDDTITLDKVIKNCQTEELTRQHAKLIHKASNNVSADVDYVTRQKFSTNSKFTHKVANQDKITNCKYCSYSHDRGACPAYSKTCNTCQKRGHFSTCCHSRKISHKVSQISNVKQYEIESSSNSEASADEETLFIGAVTDEDLNSLHEEWTIDLVSNGTTINYKLDSGAQANILPYQLYKKLSRPPKLHTTNVKLSAYNGTEIPVKGSCIIQITLKNKNIPVLFIVTDTHSTPIVGLKTSEKLNLIKRVRIDKINSKIPEYLQEFSDCFGELGCFSKTHHIETDPNVRPTINPSRRVPIALQSKLYDELQRMIAMGVIVRVDEPTDWVSNYVAVEKPDGSLRICLDPQDLNKVLDHTTIQHQLQLCLIDQSDR